MKASDLLRQYVYFHNYGIETGDFEPLMLLFENHAIFEFEDSRIGRFEGIEMIRGVFRRQSPTLEIAIGEMIETEDSARAVYASEENPERKLGYLKLESNGNKIKRLFVGK